MIWQGVIQALIAMTLLTAAGFFLKLGAIVAEFLVIRMIGDYLGPDQPEGGSFGAEHHL